MADVIISRATIRGKAQRAFAAGQSRDSHGFNPGSAAIRDWNAEFDRLTLASLASRTSHTAPAGRQRIDARQAGV